MHNHRPRPPTGRTAFDVLFGLALAVFALAVTVYAVYAGLIMGLAMLGNWLGRT